jgi:hypothetical protein
MIFYEAKFFEDVQKMHLKPDELPIYSAIPDSKVREKLSDFVDYGNHPRFAKMLDEICANLVGRTMFKLLITKMIVKDMIKTRGKIRILEYSDDGSKYSPSSRDFAVKINPIFYEENGVGISSRQYYCVNTNKIEPKLKSLAGSMFHEFCHSLHDVSRTTKRNAICLAGTMYKYIWGNDEELRTIACFNHDPICDHCFDFVQSNMKGEAFRPRYAHNIGYMDPLKDVENRRELLRYLHLSQKYMDGWKEYVI